MRLAWWALTLRCADQATGRRRGKRASQGPAAGEPSCCQARSSGLDGGRWVGSEEATHGGRDPACTNMGFYYDSERSPAMIRVRAGSRRLGGLGGQREQALLSFISPSGGGSFFQHLLPAASADSAREEPMSDASVMSREPGRAPHPQ